MKILLQLETHDLRVMLEGYFGANGFGVLNADELCAKFEEAYPAGMSVSATLLAAPPPPVSVAEEPGVEATALAAGVRTNVVDIATRGRNPTFRDADLLDPTNYGNVPRKDTINPADEELEMRRLLDASSRIQAEKDTENDRRNR